MSADFESSRVLKKLRTSEVDQDTTMAIAGDILANS